MASKPFEFLVGPEKKAFSIHLALVASQSEVLARLVLGDMQEAREGSVVWEHVDEQTFVRFSQYAYMGIYRYPSFRPGPPCEADRDSVAKIHNQKCPISKGKELWTSFKKQRSSTEPYMVMKYGSPLGDGEENDAELLLCHARLYVFADCYGITPLMNLALSTLHHVLVTIPQSDDTTGMFIKLLQFCYEMDIPAALKELVVQYATCRVEHLSKREEFQELIRVHGDFSAALVDALLDRID
ncbi:hypothetical protein E4U53_005302 [Claviceps sorghi]|nr:hypothetical protein E4U53_005302 [Claviceps sorghi]